MLEANQCVSIWKMILAPAVVVALAVTAILIGFPGIATPILAATSAKQGAAEEPKPGAAASTDAYAVAFQGPSGNLWITGTDPDATGDQHVAMKNFTNPAITALTGGGHEVAFQGANGNLWLRGALANGDQGLAMMAGTSPTIVGLNNGGYEVAFQAPNGDLWTTGTKDYAKHWSLGMMAGTSPSISACDPTSYEAAFQSNRGELWVVGCSGTGGSGLGMAAGTSPAISQLAHGNEAAFQDNHGNLWVTGYDGRGNQSIIVTQGTSPAIAAYNNDWAVAVSSPTICCPYGNFTLFVQYGSMPNGTQVNTHMLIENNPSIAKLASGCELVAYSYFQTLYLYGCNSTGVVAGSLASVISSPSIAP